VLSAAGPARRVLAGLTDLFLPEVCGGCGRDLGGEEGLCQVCGVRLLTLVSMRYCPRCGTSLGPGVPMNEEGCTFCPVPIGRFARVVRLGSYVDPLRAMLRELKYRRQEWMVARLAKMLAAAVGTRCPGETFDLVMPVPMHWRRRLWRGCDHSRLLGASLAADLRLPLGHELVRIRHTPQQAHLSRTRRLENVRGSFEARAKAALAGASILLVDDVTTTGATASEAARALLDAGASRVTLVAAAKAEPRRAYSEVFENP
jgi:ComF family protein